MDEAARKVEGGAPARPLVIGNRTLLISQPTIAALASISAAVLKRVRSRTPVSLLVNDPAFGRLPLQAQVEAAREAAKVQVSGGGGIEGAALGQEMLEPPVLAFAIWVLARPNHPELRLEDVEPWVTQDNVVALLVEVNEASGMLTLNPEGAGGPLASGKPA